jgi:1-phosphatidylinositol-3-phosphate 5-kinase
MGWNKKLRNPDYIKLDITAYFPLHFEFLRELCGYERTQFLNSILLTANFETSGGKSGSDFFQSRDAKFIAKSILADEFKHYLKVAGSYFKYMMSCSIYKKSTVLSKILGLFSI